MALRQKSYVCLDEELKSFFGSQPVRDTCNLLTDRVVDSSNLGTDVYEPNGVRFTARTLIEKVLLGLLQYYVAEELRVLINLWLEENWGTANLELKHCVLTSKELALGAILEQDKWNERDFYGNVLKQHNLEFLSRTQVRKRPSHGPKRAVRRRGYNDHGSMRLPHESEPGYDHRKLLSVVQMEQRRLFQQQDIDSFTERVLDRLWYEQISA